MATSSNTHMIVKFGKSMTIKPKTMDLNQSDLKLLVEKIVNVDSFIQNGYDLWSFFRVQECFSIFDMLNGPTYPHLVKDL